MKSLMTPQEQFSQIARPEIQRSTFDRSHGYKSTFDAGQLIPFYVDEALPGDTFKAHANIFGRMAPCSKIHYTSSTQQPLHYRATAYR